MQSNEITQKSLLVNQLHIMGYPRDLLYQLLEENSQVKTVEQALTIITDPASHAY